MPRRGQPVDNRSGRADQLGVVRIEEDDVATLRRQPLQLNSGTVRVSAEGVRGHEEHREPVGGTDRNPRFSLSDVEAWFRRQGKAVGIPADERLWQAFDSVRGVMPAPDALVMAGALLLFLQQNPGITVPKDRDALQDLMNKAGHFLVFGGTTVAAGLIDLLQPFDLGARQMTMLHEVAVSAGNGIPAEVFDYLCARFLGTAARTGLDATPAELAELMLAIAGPADGHLLDPACGPGTILLAALRRGYTRVEGQELNSSLAIIAALRLAFAGAASFDVHSDDSLRHDAFPRGSVLTVICNPPFADRNWGQEDLHDDPRWEYGVPPRLESELAWVQHALAHTAPGGTVVILMPPAAASRPSGRRIRAELLKRGALRAVVSLPPRLAAQYALPLQIWLLRRPDSETASPPPLLVVDASQVSAESSALAWDAVRNLVRTAFAGPAPDNVAREIPVMDLLDDEVDLTPARHLSPAWSVTLSPQELVARHRRLAHLLTEVRESLPGLSLPLPHPGGVREVTLDELLQTGAIFMRRSATRSGDDQEPAVRSPVVTGRDVMLGLPPSASGDFPADELRYPVIRSGDVLVPGSGPRLTARVASDQDVGARPGPTLQLIRPDPAIVDPWFLAGLLSSSAVNHQATRVSSTLGDQFRFDLRRIRVPLLPVSAQREYGEIFRELSRFSSALHEAHDLGIDLVQDIADAAVAGLAENPAELRRLVGVLAPAAGARTLPPGTPRRRTRRHPVP